jgi:hypothetical protein
MGITKKKREVYMKCKVVNPLKVVNLSGSKETCIPKTPEPKKKK